MLLGMPPVPSATLSDYHGRGIKDFGATFFARLSGQAGSSLPCGHNFDCEFANVFSTLLPKLQACSNQSKMVTAGGGGAYAGSYPGDFMDGPPCTGIPGDAPGEGVCGDGGNFGGVGGSEVRGWVLRIFPMRKSNSILLW
jgi:hypothetical protein